MRPGAGKRLAVALSAVLMATIGAGPARADEAGATTSTELMTLKLSGGAVEQDYLYEFDGTTTTLVGTYPTGTLSASGEGSSGPSPSGLEKVQTHCLKIDGAYTYGYHCFHVYKPKNGDGDPNYKYRIGWWTGSSKAKCCNDLKKIRDKAWVPDTGPPSQTVTDWKPTGTSYPPDSCTDKTVSLSVSYAGAGASVSSTFEACAETFGLDSVGPKHFFIKWEGEKDHHWWVGMGGGFEWRWKDGTGGWKMIIELEHTYCVPDWLC